MIFTYAQHVKNIVLKGLVKFSFLQDYIVSKTAHKFWSSQQSWRLKDIFYERAKKQELFIKKSFIPLLNKKSLVCDFACACGDFAFLVAPFVKRIDAFELSLSMVNLARKTAKENGIKNTFFYQADALNNIFKKTYDHFMCLGLFTCIIKDRDVLMIINKISKAIKVKGYIVVKDTVTVDTASVIHFDPKDPYSSIYRPVNKYIDFFEKNGFKLIKKIKLSKVDNNKLFSLCAIFKKII